MQEYSVKFYQKSNWGLSKISKILKIHSYITPRGVNCKLELEKLEKLEKKLSRKQT